jgi:hypothetical protein
MQLMKTCRVEKHARDEGSSSGTWANAARARITDAGLANLEGVTNWKSWS